MLFDYHNWVQIWEWNSTYWHGTISISRPNIGHSIFIWRYLSVNKVQRYLRGIRSVSFENLSTINDKWLHTDYLPKLLTAGRYKKSIKMYGKSCFRIERVFRRGVGLWLEVFAALRAKRVLQYCSVSLARFGQKLQRNSQAPELCPLVLDCSGPSSSPGPKPQGLA